MTTLIAIEADALTTLIEEVTALRRAVEGANIMPKKDWLTIAEYAELIGKTTRTVRRYIEKGQLETCERVGTTLIRAPEA